MPVAHLVDDLGRAHVHVSCPRCNEHSVVEQGGKYFCPGEGCGFTFKHPADSLKKFTKDSESMEFVKRASLGERLEFDIDHVREAGVPEFAVIPGEEGHLVLHCDRCEFPDFVLPASDLPQFLKGRKTAECLYCMRTSVFPPEHAPEGP